MNEEQTAIVYINLVVTGSEAHNSRKASQGGGNLNSGFRLQAHRYWVYSPLSVIYLLEKEAKTSS